ncbi:unnamed protein product [Gongylonema pulchrum]|uniref:RNA-directed DNA polymerase, eukaryota, reverse transcriptase zinc-binding domain protein n=1 Tax=Gongylonema pulchrum TaxID=637853 RepID=A0A183D610_9BILA|nr:unnamed protein product [Gongylonema pulchrum]
MRGGILGDKHIYNLFYDVLQRFCFCWIARRNEARKIEEAKARMRSASRSFLTHSIAIEPSSIMFKQAFGKNFFPLTEAIEEVC